MKRYEHSCVRPANRILDIIFTLGSCSESMTIACSPFIALGLETLFFGLILFVHVIMEQVTVGLGVLYPNILRKLPWMLHPPSGFVILTLIIVLAASYVTTQHYPDSNRRVTLAQRLSIFSKALLEITVVLAFITQIPAFKSGFLRASSISISVTAIIRIPSSSVHFVTSLAAILDHPDITTAISTSTISTSNPIESFLISWKDEAQVQRKEDILKVEMYMEQVSVMFDRQSEVFVR